MAKLIAILNVIAWAGFWAFGYLALTADTAAGGQLVTALILAALGAALGLWAWL
jgi:L-serine deaminase